MLVNPEGNMKTRGLNVGQSRRDDKILDVKGYKLVKSQRDDKIIDVKMLIINQTPKG